MITGVVGSSQYVIPASSWSTSTTTGTGTHAPLWDGVETWIGFDEGQDDMMTSSPYPTNFVDSSTTGWLATTSTGPKIAYENGRLFQTATTGVYSSTGPTVAGTQVWSTTTINDLIYFNGTYYAFGDNGVWGTSTNGTTWTNQATKFTNNDIYCCATNGSVLVTGGGSGEVWYTTNGTSWTKVTNAALGTTAVSRMVYANGYFAATNASGVFSYSSTGSSSTWTAVTTGLTSAIGVLTFHMGRWVVIQTTSTNPKVSSSGDPTTMTFGNATSSTVSGGRANRKASNQAYIVWTVSGVTYYAR